MVRAGSVAVILLVATPAAADDDPCVANVPEAGAPTRAPQGPSDFGVVPEACPRYELSARAGMGVLIDEPNFYGSLGLTGVLRGRLPLPGGGWLSASFPGVAFDFVANATVEATALNLSASTLGLHVPVPVNGMFALAPYVRWLLPTETILQNASRFGFEQGIAFVASFHPIFEVTGGYALPLTMTTSGLATQNLFRPTVVVDAGLRPWSWLEVLAGGQLRMVPAHDPEPLEGVDARASIRIYPWRGALIDVAGAFPLAGRDRSLLAAGLGLGWVADP